MKRVEAAIQRELVRWIKETFPHVRMQATLNENSRNQMDMGCEKGIPDLLLFLTVGDVCHVIFFELKRMKGRLSEDQKEWRKPAGTNTHYGLGYGLIESKEVLTKIIGELK